MRPNLTKDINIQIFKEFYWLKKELQSFCREIGISTTGSKIEITKRIEVYLLTGEVQSSGKKAKRYRKADSEIDLSLKTVISENHHCSQNVRAFFKSVIPNFHFSTYIQNYFKSNIGKTYQDVVDAWYEEENRKKNPAYKKRIAPQFEYNQFIHDFFADPDNNGKSRSEAVEAWNIIKKLPGSNKYKSKY